MNMQRIERLRARALSYTACYEEFYYLFHKALGADASVTYESYAAAYTEAMQRMTVHIEPDELIVGRGDRCREENQIAEWNESIRALAERRQAETNGGGNENSHMAIDYELVLREGLLGIIDRIDGYLANCDRQKRPFYLCCRACCQAVIAHAERYADEAERQASITEDANRRAELDVLARICRRVPAHGAESFYEAVQSAHFITYAVSIDPLLCFMQQFQLGHPDRYLWPYYERDRVSGAITRERAQLLLDCLGIQINMRVYSGLSSGYMVGGRDENGCVVANELTEMCMQVIDDIRLTYPAVGLCYTPDLPEKYLQQACEILSHGRSHPAIFNDDVIACGLQRWGVPEKESHNYIHSTCVEITPVAASNVWVACPYTNMAQLLLDTMDREYGSYEEHLSVLMQRLDSVIRQNYEQYNGNRRRRAKVAIRPLLSCLVNDCLARGLDIDNGGARYNWIMPSFVGMANLVDSLYALKHIVYDTHEMTVRGFKAVLDADFEGYEALRQRLLNALPKYGNDNNEIDAYFGHITGHILAECKKYECLHSEGKLIPSVFCWIMHEQFGRVTGATPDGRLAGFPLGDGSGPCQGRERKGPTASILSSTKWEHCELIGGVAVNMKFSKALLGAESLEAMATLIKVYMARGGFELQINVTDRELLERARANPEQYRDLVVRIGGYSDYFTRLSPQMQQEIILRTEHRI